MERWAAVETLPGYSVSTLGRMRGVHGKLLSLSPGAGGYVTVGAIVGGKQVGRKVHRLVAGAFVPAVQGKEVVNHINGVRHDNRASNLEWVTPKENAERKVHPTQGRAVRGVTQFTEAGETVKQWASITDASRQLGVDRALITRCCRGTLRRAGGCGWKYTDALVVPENEEWREVTSNGITCTVSSLGRVRAQSGAVGRGGRSDKYREFRGVQVHRLVALAFCPRLEGKPWVNHKDGDPANNQASNLEWASPAENAKHAYETGLRPRGNPGAYRAVRQTKPTGEVSEHESIAAAEKATGVCRASITNVCRGRKRTAGGSKWEYAETACPLTDGGTGDALAPLTDEEVTAILQRFGF